MCVIDFLWLVLPEIEERDDFYGCRIISMALCQMMGWFKESAGSHLFEKMVSVFGQGI